MEGAVAAIVGALALLGTVGFIVGCVSKDEDAETMTDNELYMRRLNVWRTESPAQRSLPRGTKLEGDE